MLNFSLEDIQQSAELIYQTMAPTAQYRWPQLHQALGVEVWVKHENHTPTGAFKVRGGITFVDWLRHTHPDVKGIVTATRGNHGQSQARAAVAAGISAKIFVPIGNSEEKNAAMRAFGGEVIEYGRDFDEAKARSQEVAEDKALFVVPAFHPQIVKGVASYALELFHALPKLDCVYVPIGCGSGICSLIMVRDLLGLETEVVGVVSTEAQGAKLSVETGKMIATDSARTFADGMAVRAPIPEAFDIYRKGAARVVAVSDDEVAAAMRLLFVSTHNVAEGAGAAALAALMQEKDRHRGKRVGVILCGGNIDSDMFSQVLAGQTPQLPETG